MTREGGRKMGAAATQKSKATTMIKLHNNII
jgi:hypothetical protein